MRTIVDLHMHSHFSRATSKKLNVAGIAKYGAIKGIDLIATGDITHPKWLQEIAGEMQEDGSGFLRLKDGSSDMRFALFGEVASIYKRGGQGRRVHTLFGVSSIAAAQKVNKKLESLGYNISYDGRPIIGMDVRELAKIYLEADPRAARPLIPFKSIVPLPEIIASAFGCGVNTKRVDAEFDRIIAALGNEFHALLDAELDEVRLAADPVVAEGISRMRSGDIHIEPGYDGEFGKIEVFTESERAALKPQQKKLFESGRCRDY